MFGIGTPELLVIFVLALVVVGPQRLPDLARSIGRALREFRKVQDEVRDMVQTGIGDDLDDVRKEIRGAKDELRRTSKEITGGLKEATDIKPLLPTMKRGTHGNPRPQPDPAASDRPAAAPSEDPPGPARRPAEKPAEQAATPEPRPTSTD
jgi:Tat protein translocase TatB subunit